MIIETAVRDHLAVELGVPAFASVPEERPGEFVTVERTGGPTEAFRDLPALAVQFWARSPMDAAELCARGVAALGGMWELPGVCRAEVTASYSFPDPDSRQSRYQAVCELVTA